jgi:hypothetical protein
MKAEGRYLCDAYNLWTITTAKNCMYVEHFRASNTNEVEMWIFEFSCEVCSVTKLVNILRINAQIFPGCWRAIEVASAVYTSKLCMLEKTETKAYWPPTRNSQYFTVLLQDLKGMLTYESNHFESFVWWQVTELILISRKAKLNCICKIWGFHGGDYEECRLLGCYVVGLL